MLKRTTHLSRAAGHGRRARGRHGLALLASTAVAAMGGLALSAAPASAQYYGGCTYSWGAPCYIVYGGMNFLITTDPDNAYADWQNTRPFNGYKPATPDHRERDVCGTMMYQEGTLSPYGWTCGWGQVIQTYPGIVGYSAIGTGQAYYGIALYQMIDLSEYGPCPAQGNPECG